MTRWVLGAAVAAVACSKGDDGRPPGDRAEPHTGTVVDSAPGPEPRTFVRLAHVATAVGPIDLWIDGGSRPLASAFAPPDGTPFAGQEPGRRAFSVTLPGEDPNAGLARLQAELPEGARTTLVVFGGPAHPEFVAIPEVVTDFPRDQVRYTFFGAVSGLTPAVTLHGATSPAPYGQRVVLAELPPAPQEVSVDLEQDGVADCVVTVQGIAAGTIASMYLVDVAGVPTLFGYDPDGRFVALDGGACTAGGGGSGTGAHTGSGGSGATDSGGA